MSNRVYGVYPHQQVRGTLPPGHTLVVNKHTIQVERYLSQGGFAHVYVVRTANPINNTTQHVLKRIAVADQAMLAEVKKEVDVMRALRGHPNIVEFIDASWNLLPNGTYEVLILMELCSGGGIIDMMNRRLRERLTEAEILQIFVDVCEAVAVMHNLKPPLLHRDLKVENILQSSPTLYKLCDFGSATPVAPRPPSSAQEIRALEADLNRHTTLQYRAPEMVDVYLRRPVDEKSDVWALGVFLYKLCYYTTPFEEHGPLAILNVQYRIPPYPVYSTQMNQLIASMLRELGTQRPSVFEILYQVHSLRGSKSRYVYNIPMQNQVRAPMRPLPQTGVEDIVAFRNPSMQSAGTSSAAQARKTVLDAIAPMRRGRPAATSISSISDVTSRKENELDIRKFEEQWKAAKIEAGKTVDDAWGIGTGKAKDEEKPAPARGLDGFGDSFTDTKFEKPTQISVPYSSQSSNKPISARLEVKKDAFEGLGLPRSREVSPTLGEASERRRKSNSPSKPTPLTNISRTPVPPPVDVPLSPHIPASRTGLATYRSPISLSIEERFPSLDDLDKGWLSPPAPQIPQLHPKPQHDHPEKAATTTQHGVFQPSTTIGARPPLEQKPYTAARGEARSQQVTGTAMRSTLARGATVMQPVLPPRPATPPDQTDKRSIPIGNSPTKYRPSRPALARKHRSSTSMKYTEPKSPTEDLLTGVSATRPVDAPPSPVRKQGPVTLSPSPPARGSGGQENSRNVTQGSSALSTMAREQTAFSRPLRRAKTPPNRQDSSSDDAEGPEDVNDRVVPENIRKSRTKGRQSSVHDLVDLYGGSGRTSTDKDRAGPPSPVSGRKGRRTSGILVDLSVPSSAPSQPALLSPASIVPESRAELASRRPASGSRRDSASPSSNSSVESREYPSRPASRTSPIADGRDKPRPQSMFMVSPKPLDLTQNRRVSGEVRRRHSPRRGSISDMVDLYENLGGGAARPKEPPMVASKAANSKFKRTPSPIASRFPIISPTGMSFSPNEATAVLADVLKVRPKPRRAPTTDSYLDSISSSSPTMPDGRKEFVSRVPRRQPVSPLKTAPAPVKTTTVSAMSLPSKPAKPPPLSIGMPTRNVVLPAAEPETPGREPPTPASPDRPYQGVGKLIDQWQKKTEEAEASRHLGPKSPGRPLGPRGMGRTK